MFIQLQNVRLFYEKTGSGPAVLLLHGNGEDHTIFNTLVEKLSQTHTVYAIDSRCHGQSSCAMDLSYAAMAKDVEAFIAALGLERPAVCGFSDGGIVGLLVAVRNPGLLSRLIVCGANTNPNGIKWHWLLLFRIIYTLTRSQNYSMMLTQPNISPAALKKVDTPVLVLAGSRDLIRQEHTRQLAENLPNAQLQILPDESHTSYVMNSPKLYPIIAPFLGI